MAAVAVSTTGYWGVVTPDSGTWAGLVAGDTVTISGGAVITVDPAQSTTGTAVGVNIICISGFSKFRIVNSSTTAAFVFYGNYQGAIDVQAGCEWEMSGDWITIYTGDGTANQTTGTGWTTAGYNAADEPGALYVETGSGTNVYEIWKNVADLSGGLDDIGVGELGRWFSYNNATGVGTFGDGGEPEDIAYDAVATDTYVDVADASAFSASDYIHVRDETNDVQYTTTIASISAGGGASGSDRVNLDDAIPFDTDAADDCFIRLVSGGNVIPNGAKVRTPNIGIGTMNAGTRTFAASRANNWELDTRSAGILTWDTVNVFGFYFWLREAAPGTFTDVTSVATMLFASSPNQTLTRWTKGLDRYESSETIAHHHELCSGVTFLECTVCSISARSFYLDDSPSCEFEDCTFIVANRTGTHYSLLAIGSDGGRFDSCDFIGDQAQFQSGDINLTDCRHSDSVDGAPHGSAYSYAIYGAPYLGTVDNFSQIRDGAYTTSSYMLRGITLLKDTDIDFPGTYLNQPFQQSDFRMINCNSGSAIAAAVSATKSFVIQNCESDGFASGWVAPGSEGTIIKGLDVSSRNAPTGVAFGSDTHFYEARTSATVGCMGVFFQPKTFGTAYVATNEADWNWTYKGIVYCAVDGATLEYTWPHAIIGITGFPATGTFFLSGSGTGNFDFEYKIDVGSGYGASWQTLSYANLNAETIDPTIGFRFKLLITHNGTGNNYLNGYNWLTDLDYSTYRYPENIVDVVLENVADGSTYLVENTDQSTILEEGSQSGTGDITIENVPYSGADENLAITVRKASASPLYKSYMSNATLTSTGARVYVSQVPDE